MTKQMAGKAESAEKECMAGKMKFSERKQRGKRNMGKFTFTQTEIPGVVVIEPQVFGDDRGYFMETYL